MGGGSGAVPRDDAATLSNVMADSPESIVDSGDRRGSATVGSVGSGSPGIDADADVERESGSARCRVGVAADADDPRDSVAVFVLTGLSAIGSLVVVDSRENAPHGFSKMLGVADGVDEDISELKVELDEADEAAVGFHGFTNPEPAGVDVCGGSSPHARSVSRLLNSAVRTLGSAPSCPVFRRSFATPTYASCTTDSAADAFEDNFPHTDLTPLFEKKSGGRMPEFFGVTAGELGGTVGGGVEEGNPLRENADADDIGLKLSGRDGLGRGVCLGTIDGSPSEGAGESDRGVVPEGVR